MSNFLTLLGGEGDSFYEAVLKHALEDRTLIINQEITDDVIENYIYHILRWNAEDKNLPIEARTKIKLIFNSPGGDCFVGFGMVDVIKSSKTPIVAIGIGSVASMAYHMFICCHERIAFPNTILLQHDGNVHISNSGSKAKDTMRFIENMEARAKQHVLSHTKMTEEFYDSIYENEYYMYADEKGKEFGCVDKIVGQDIDLDDVF